MKKLFVLFALPIAAFCHKKNPDLFHFSERGDESLCHIEFEPETEGGVFDEEQSLSLLEIDEGSEVLIPWLVEDLACDDVTDLLDRWGPEVYEEFEDVFVYEAPCYGGRTICTPTYEKVAEEKRRFFHRPRVVEILPRAKEVKGSVAGESYDRK